MKLTRILRVIHRDLGFFVVGITLVYGVSGIYLNHMNGKDPAFRTEKKTIQLPANLTKDELADAWQADKKLPPLKRIMPVDESHSRLFLDGGVGIYNASNGTLDYERYEKRVLVYWVNRLHYSKVQGWNLVADFFAGSLILLAITSLFMVKGKRGIAGSGKWYLLIGLLIPVIFIVFFLR